MFSRVFIFKEAAIVGKNFASDIFWRVGERSIKISSELYGVFTKRK